MIPIMARITSNMLTRPIIVTIKANLQEMASTIVLIMLYTIA